MGSQCYDGRNVAAHVQLTCAILIVMGSTAGPCSLWQSPCDCAAAVKLEFCHSMPVTAQSQTRMPDLHVCHAGGHFSPCVRPFHL